MKSLAGVQQLYKADSGGHGTKQRQHGRAGRDAVVLVPVGTVVHRLPPKDGDTSAADAGGGFSDSPTTAAAAAAVAAQQQGAAGVGEEEELPEWLRRWTRPFTGEDYSSEGEDDLEGSSTAGLRDPPEWAADAAAAGGSSRAAQQQRQQPQDLLADLTEPGQEVVVASGGDGGRGNASLKARAHRPAPAESEVGCPGVECAGLGVV